MVYVGIDLHRKRSQIAVLDQDGNQLLSRRIVNEPETFLSLLHELGNDARIAPEATYGWEWLADLLPDVDALCSGAPPCHEGVGTSL